MVIPNIVITLIGTIIFNGKDNILYPYNKKELKIILFINLNIL